MQKKAVEQRIGLVILTLNAGAGFAGLLQACRQQHGSLSRCLVVDSSSEDDTAALARSQGFEVWEIPRSAFNHGGTRQQALEHLSVDTDIVIFLTQDVQLYDADSFRHLLAVFADPTVAAAYGRQLPFPGASLDARLSREFNYPAASRIKAWKDRRQMGIKTAFLSDSFAAYRVRSLQRTGGFPRQVNVCEDMYAAAKLLMAGYRIAYAAEAKVYHSHSYTWRENFNRYYQTGVFQKREDWIVKAFGKSEGEGRRLLQYQLQRAWSEAGARGAVKILADTLVKYAAFRLGRL